MRSARQQSVLLAITALAILLLLALLVWISTSNRDRPGVEVVRTSPAAPSSSTSAPSDVSAPPATDAPARTEIAESAPAKPKAVREESAATPVAKDRVTLLVKFTRPDKSELELASGVVELRAAKGAARRENVDHQKSMRITGLAPGVYAARVITPDLEHREQFLDLRKLEEAQQDGDEFVFEKRLILWPPQWIAVIVETTDGRSFSALATDLGFQPMKLFVGAFQVHTQISAPRYPSGLSSIAPSEAQRGESELARFRPPPDYKSWELTKSCVGSLELLHAPPLWVELVLFGKSAGWESLQAGAREVVFRIDRSTLEDRFARVTARIVDPKDHAPIAKALVTLRADTSAHRREDLTNVPTGPDGRVVLERIVPGRYELAVARGESQHQEMIALGISERRDLGDIELGEAKPIEVLVVDDAGNPRPGTFVEIGPYKKGERSSELYPQMMRHSSGDGGRAKLPMPTGTAIVRAAVEIGRSHQASQEVRGMRSANVLIDPRSPPPQPIRLTLVQPVEIKLSTKRADNVRIEVLDELDVVVARSVKDTDRKLDVEIVPGRYRAHTIAADGTIGLTLRSSGRQAGRIPSTDG